MATVVREQVKNRIGDSSPTKERLLESLRQQGIQDLDTFAERAVHAHKESQPRPWAEIMPELSKRSPEEAMAELLFGSKAQSDASSRPHSIPKLPFVVNDRHYKPSEIERFNGKAIHYIWDEDLIARGFVRAVTDRDEYVALLTGAPAGDAPGTVVRSHVPGAGHVFFQHINFAGNVLSLGPRHGYPDLTRVTMTGAWFWATSWNDQISSLITGSSFVTLCEHTINPILTGATMLVPANRSVPFVGAAWNDRVSAILG